MKLYVNGFWKGFVEKTDQVHVGFFIDLFGKIFEEEIELGDLDSSDILLESLFTNRTYLFEKKWKYTFLFSGESRLNIYENHYDCILCCESNNKNKINLPLFIPNIYCNNLLNKFDKFKKIDKIKTKDFCCIISNPSGWERNYYLDELDKYFKIDYYGAYKNNQPNITYPYNSEEFIKVISDYKFVVTMENSRANFDTYITEKILQGFLANNIPIYWGSKKVSEYFNPDRFINIEEMNETNIEKSIEKIKELLNNDDKYIQVINQDIFTNNHLVRYFDDIVNDVKKILFNNKN